MTPHLAQQLTELEQFGKDNDATHSERPRRMLNITRDTGEFLFVQILATGARRILEIGTSNGYSTLWLAHAASQTGGHVTTVEYSDSKAAMAQANFARAGLAERITLLQRDAGEVLADSAGAAYDLVFLDSERAQYLGWWPSIQHILRPGGLLVVDNATSHAAEMAPFMAQVVGDGWPTSLLPLGNGEFLAVRPG